MPDSSASSERILVRGVNWLGDAVMTTPALQRLREAHPDAHIALLTASKLADLWKHHPDIDQVLTFEPGESPWSIGRRLRRFEFTTALVLPNSPRSALEVFLGGIPRRVGHSRSWRNWLLTHRVPPRAGETPMRKRTEAEIHRLIRTTSDFAASSVPPESRSAQLEEPLTSALSPSDGVREKVAPAEAHHIYQYLNLAAALGANARAVAPRLAVTDAEVQAVRQKFGSGAAPKDRPLLLGLNAGAEYGPAKRWPRERFIDSAIKVQASSGCQCWVFGGPDETDFARGIADSIAAVKKGPPDSVRCLAGQTSLRDLCAALKACDVLLTNDSGPMHVAAAVGTRVVALFGSTSPELTGPGLPGDPRHRLLSCGAPCSPCFQRECPIDLRCMSGISVENAVAAVLELLSQGQPETR
jgi:ADP-heptose:LPS heptosyltransferase